MLIDTHVHVGGGVLGYDMEEDMVLTAMQRYGIDYALVSNCDAVEVDHDQKLIPGEQQISQEECLKRVLALARKRVGKYHVEKYPLKVGRRCAGI